MRLSSPARVNRPALPGLLLYALLASSCRHGPSELAAPPPATTPPLAPRSQDWPTELRAALRGADFAQISAEAEARTARGAALDALTLRAALAEHRHDVQAMQAVLDDPGIGALRASAGHRASLAFAVSGVLGPAAALEDLTATCSASTVAITADERSKACGRAALGRRLKDHPRTLEGADVELDILPKIAIPIVLLSVNGLPPEPFIVDTGAAGTVIAKAYADRAQIPYSAEYAEVSHDAAGGEVRVIPTMVSSLGGKDWSISNVEAVVIELPPNFKIGGIIAPHRAFAGALIELDQRAKKLRVHRTLTLDAWATGLGEPTFRSPLIWDGGNVFVYARLGEATAGFMNFDTGAAGSVITLETAKRLGQTIDLTKAVEAMSVTKHASYPAFEEKIAFGDDPGSTDALVPIERKPRSDALEPIGNVGESWLKGRRVAIAPDGRSIAFTAPQR